MAELKITKENFEAEVLKAKLPVLLDFWAPWCGPCRILTPVIASIAEKYEGRVIVGKVNVDDEPELAAEFRVSSIPMVAVVKDEEVKNLLVGYRPEAEIVAMLEEEL